MEQVLLTMFFIMIFRICDVSLATLRTILLTKGMSKIAAAIGFFEVIIYIKVLGSVVNQLDNWFYLIAYAIGFAMGNLIGSKLEKFFAFGDAQIRIILTDQQAYAIQDLRDKGFGVTVFRGEGRDGERLMVLITLKRKRVSEVFNYFHEKDINAFISVNDISSQMGAYMGKSNISRPNARV